MPEWMTLLLGCKKKLSKRNGSKKRIHVGMSIAETIILMRKNSIWQKKKRLDASFPNTTENINYDGTKYNSPLKRCTRSQTQPFNPFCNCLVCSKVCYRSNKPNYVTTSKKSENPIHRRAKVLNRFAILRRMVGLDFDSVAYDIRYHKPCMD